MIRSVISLKDKIDTKLSLSVVMENNGSFTFSIEDNSGDIFEEVNLESDQLLELIEAIKKHSGCI